MKVSGCYFTQRGRKSENEDAVLPLLSADNRWWAAVADGIGGRAGGQIASTAAIEILRSKIESAPGSTTASFFDSVRDRLKLLASEKPNFSKMGTTLSLVSISGKHAHVGHVGDSRIYHLRNEGIINRTVDQTEVRELIERGVLTKASARRYPRRNVLLSALSPEKDFDLFENEFDVRAGDRILLVTDGVSSKVLAQELRDISLQSESPDAFCASLMKEVASRAPVDDYTAICIDIGS